MLRRQLGDLVVITLSTASAVISAVFVPSPWRWVLVGIAAVVDAVSLRAARTRALRDNEHDMLISRTPEAQIHALALAQFESNRRDALVRQHFDITEKPLGIACRYCRWTSTAYDRRLIDGPQHLHNAHPECDPSTPRWLRRRSTAWLARRLLPRLFRPRVT